MSHFLSSNLGYISTDAFNSFWSTWLHADYHRLIGNNKQSNGTSDSRLDKQDWVSAVSMYQSFSTWSMLSGCTVYGIWYTLFIIVIVQLSGFVSLNQPSLRTRFKISWNEIWILYLLFNRIALEVQNTVGVGAVLMLTQSQQTLHSLLLYFRCTVE